MAAPLSRRILSLVTLNSLKSKHKIRVLHTTCGSLFIKSQAQPSMEQLKPDLILSDSCVEQLHKLGEQTNCLRVIVDGGGCSGYQYTFEVVPEPTKGDRVFEKDGCRVVVDKESLEFIKGSTIDFHEELIRSAFRVIENPQAGKGCSCGASFSLKI